MSIPATREEQEIQYGAIVALFDHCDALADSLQNVHAAGDDPEAQLVILAPLMSDVSAEADLLTEEYINIAEAQNNPAKLTIAKTKVEASLRKIYLAIDQYRLRVRQSARVAAHAADELVAKLQEQVEAVVLVFASIIDLTISRIMQSSQLESFKQRHKDAMLAFQQYNQGLAAH